MFRQIGVGEFSAEVTGCCHCGPNHETPKNFHYQVEIHYHDHCLDNDGMLLDNSYFRDWFNGLQVIEHSCEHIARRASQHFISTADGCLFVETRIRAFQDGPHAAFIGYSIEKEKAEFGFQSFPNVPLAHKWYEEAARGYDCTVRLQSGHIVTFRWTGAFASPIVLGQYQNLRS